MDREKKRRRQSYRVIASEIIMTLAVIVTVISLAFVVSGYWVNSDFKVERQGLLQISSVPTGAEVIIDDKAAWLQRTNTSKVLSSGKHTIKLKKDGYDSWSKTVEISEGLLYRIHYPRLFLLKREKEKILDISGITLASVSPNREMAIMINNTTEWKLINLDREKAEINKINISEYFSSASVAEGASVGLFGGEIISIDWAKDNSHVLFKVKNGEEIEWALIDVKNLKNSTNLTKEFGATFTDVRILDNSANSLLVVQNNNLHKIDVSGKAISAIIVDNVVSFDHFENEIAYIAKLDSEFEVGITKIGDSKLEKLETITDPAKILISKFYDDKYLTIIQNDNVNLFKEDDFSRIQEFRLSFVPEKMKVGHNGEFIIMFNGANIATLDMESTNIIEWSLGGERYGWLDDDMIYAVNGGELTVYDFDGLNHRVLASNVSGHFPVTITSDKWLYYISDDSLIREWLVEH